MIFQLQKERSKYKRKKSRRGLSL